MWAYTRCKTYPEFLEATGYLDVIDPRAKLSERELLGVSRTHYRTFQRNAFLFYADSTADTGYLIRSGHVRCFLLDADGRETTTALLGPGQFLGTATLLNLQTHHEFCEALTPVEAWTLPADELRSTCAGSPLIQGWLLGSIGRHLELALALRRGIALLSAADRAADLQLRLHALSGVDPGAVRQTSLAKLLQIRPETLARANPAWHQRQRARAAGGERLGPGRSEFAAERHVVRGYLPEGCIGQVVSGDVELSLTASGSRAVVVETLKQGDLFGFSSLLALPGLAYSLAGAAPGAIAVIAHDQFLRSLALLQAESGHMVIRLADRVQSLEQQLARAALPDVGDRLIRVLREAAAGDGTRYVPATCSHDVLARRLGVCRETVTRGLATLVKAGVITRQGRRIVLVSEQLPSVNRRDRSTDRLSTVNAPGVDAHDAPPVNKCRLCGLRAPATLCLGCAERLERDLERDQDRACPQCGRHRELCQAVPCTTPSPTRTNAPNTTTVWLPIAWIDEPGAARNSRHKYTDRSIQELAISLQQEGFLQPICVRRSGTRFELVFGVRRFRAAMRAGLSEVPCTVRDADDGRAFVLNALENRHREHLSNLERVHTIERLGNSGLGVREISRRTGFNASTISRWLRINRRPELKRALEDNRLDVARAVILVDAPEPVVSSLIDSAMTVSTAELRRQISAIKAGARQAAQNDRRLLTEALRYLRSVRSDLDEPLLIETLQMEIDRIAGRATIAAPGQNAERMFSSSVAQATP